MNDTALAVAKAAKTSAFMVLFIGYIIGNIMWALIVHGLSQLTGICWLDIDYVLRPGPTVSWYQIHESNGTAPDRRNIFQIILDAK
jgi:hypothetical protein